MPGESFTGPPPRPGPAEEALAERLGGHVTALAGDIGERNVFRPEALAAALAYVERQWEGQGHTPRREVVALDKESFLARFRASLAQRTLPSGLAVFNLVAEIPGIRKPGECILLGAHYDTVALSPGANDNGTGVAALIELARSLRDARPARTIRLVAFVNEEPPFFRTPLMGSRVHAAGARARGERITAMFSLETMGHFDTRPGSQHYPWPLGRYYPDRGNFIAFVANLASRQLVRQAITAFRRNTAFPSEGLAAPAWIPGVDWSDQLGFWKAGYPAVMVTDTAPYRYPHYHARTDTPDKVDCTALARIVGGLHAMVLELAAEGNQDWPGPKNL